jgi:hypothetical protein
MNARSAFTKARIVCGVPQHTHFRRLTPQWEQVGEAGTLAGSNRAILPASSEPAVPARARPAGTLLPWVGAAGSDEVDLLEEEYTFFMFSARFGRWVRTKAPQAVLSSNGSATYRAVRLLWGRTPT